MTAGPALSRPHGPVVVCALYRFVALENYRELRQPLLELMEQHRLRGSLLLAVEGINGTVAGTRQGIDALRAWLNRDPRLVDIPCKESFCEQQPFLRAKVRLKQEIVTMGVTGIDPGQAAGTYVKPADWNALLSDPEVILIDTRNRYEVELGSFRNAVNPQTERFRDFPRFVEKSLDPSRHKKIAMFCTGGIRCEKSTAYLRSRGFEKVYHLEGGILKYLEEIPRQESLWRGECFVFDQRVSVTHRLERGGYEECRSCRMPVSPRQRNSKKYRPGISCPHCHDSLSDRKRARLEERQRQVELSRQRGEAHLGGNVQDIALKRKADKTKRRRAAGRSE